VGACAYPSTHAPTIITEKFVATIDRAVGAILVMSPSNILDVVVADLVLGGQARLPGVVRRERRDVVSHEKVLMFTENAAVLVLLLHQPWSPSCR
jgi:hypothetical protein